MIAPLFSRSTRARLEQQCIDVTLGRFSRVEVLGTYCDHGHTHTSIWKWSSSAHGIPYKHRLLENYTRWKVWAFLIHQHCFHLVSSSLLREFWYKIEIGCQLVWVEYPSHLKGAEPFSKKYPVLQHPTNHDKTQKLQSGLTWPLARCLDDQMYNTYIT